MQQQQSPARTLDHALLRAVERWPDRLAINSVPDGVRLTYRELDSAVASAARALTDLEIEVHDRVAVMMPNRIEYPVLWLACARLGAILTPVHVAARALDAGHVIRRSSARLVVTDAERARVIAGLKPEIGPRRVLDADALLASGSWTAPFTFRPHPETPVSIQFTCGTAGPPKGCVLTHRYWLTLADKNINYAARVTTTDVLLTAQPFSYMDPFWSLATSIVAGGTLVVLDRFHPTTFWREVRRHGATVFYCLGVMPRLMLKVPEHADDRRHHVRVVLCSGIPQAAHAELERRFCTPWLETYGMTETGNIACVTLEDHARLVGSGAVGRTLPFREVRIVGDDGEQVPRGRVGQIVVRGVGMMDGYWDDPDATANSFRRGWFLTGDQGKLDDNGLLYVEGRTKDMIRRSGENISAAEVEEALERHSAVSVAAAVPVPDELRGEEVKAHLVLADRRDDLIVLCYVHSSRRG